MNRWEQSYNKYASMMFRVALRVLKSPDAANDIVHDAFLKFGINITKIDNAEAWLRRVTRNLAIDASRRHGNRNHSPEMLEFIPAVPDTRSEVEELAEEALRHFNCLDSIHKNAIQDRIEGLTAAQSGARYGIPVGTAFSRLSNARSTLKKSLVQA